MRSIRCGGVVFAVVVAAMVAAAPAPACSLPNVALLSDSTVAPGDTVHIEVTDVYDGAVLRLFVGPQALPPKTVAGGDKSMEFRVPNLGDAPQSLSITGEVEHPADIEGDGVVPISKPLWSLSYRPTPVTTQQPPAQTPAPQPTTPAVDAPPTPAPAITPEPGARRPATTSRPNVTTRAGRVRTTERSPRVASGGAHRQAHRTVPARQRAAAVAPGPRAAEPTPVVTTAPVAKAPRPARATRRLRSHARHVDRSASSGSTPMPVAKPLRIDPPVAGETERRAADGSSDAWPAALVAIAIPVTAAMLLLGWRRFRASSAPCTPSSDWPSSDSAVEAELQEILAEHAASAMLRRERALPHDRAP